MPGETIRRRSICRARRCWRTRRRSFRSGCSVSSAPAARRSTRSTAWRTSWMRPRHRWAGAEMADRVDDPPASGGEAEPPDFVLELLAELRVAGYHPGAWWRFFARSWQRSRATAWAHPALVCSWGMTVATLAAAQAAALALEAAVEGERSTALRAIPGTALAFAFTHFDMYCHLGMNARRRGDEPSPSLGLPTRLTLARGACAGLLWGHLLGGRPAGRPLLLAALAGASVTDIADGAVARATGQVTRLGQYADS